MSGFVGGANSKSGTVDSPIKISAMSGNADNIAHIGIRKNPVAGENVGIQGDRSDLNSSAFTIRKAD